MDGKNTYEEHLQNNEKERNAKNIVFDSRQLFDPYYNFMDPTLLRHPRQNFIDPRHPRHPRQNFEPRHFLDSHPKFFLITPLT